MAAAAACAALAGNAKDVCVEEAKAIETRSLADAKLGKQIGQARHQAARDVDDADYKLALGHCEDLAGDAKSD